MAAFVRPVSHRQSALRRSDSQMAKPSGNGVAAAVPQRSLPIEKYLDPLFTAMRDNRVVGLFAPTGSGKSTGVAENIITRDVLAKLGCSKAYMSIPTVVACNTLVQHVRTKLGAKGERFGSGAGSVYSPNFSTAELSVCTTQVVINQLIRLYKEENSMNDLLIIIDEAHHTSMENTVLMHICDWLIAKGYGVRVLIMTATPSQWDFENLVASAEINVSYDDVPHFPITEHFLSSDIYSVGDIRSCRTDFSRLLPEILRTVRHALASCDGNGLVFVPGESEAEEVAAMISCEFRDIAVSTIYSSRSKEEIAEAITVQQGVRKIFVGTNAVETSITLPVRFVVDTLCHKTMIMKNRNGRVYGELAMEVISQSASRQRRGRCGRIYAGDYFPLCTREFLAKMNQHSVSSFITGDKAMPVLNLLGADMPAFEMLNLTPADISMITGRLTKLGLMDCTSNKLTNLGKNIGKFPLPLEFSVLLSKCDSDDDEQKNMLTACLLVSIISAKDNGGSPIHFPKGTKGPEKKEFLLDNFNDYFYSDDITGIVRMVCEVILETNWCGRGTGKYMKEHHLSEKFFRHVIRIFRQIAPNFLERPTPSVFEDLMERICSGENIFETITPIARTLFPVYSCGFRGGYVESGIFNATTYSLDSNSLTSRRPSSIIAFNECAITVPNKKMQGTMMTLNLLSMFLPLY